MNILKNKLVWGVAITFALFKGTISTFKFGPVYGLLFGLLWFFTGALIATLWVTVQKKIYPKKDDLKTNPDFYLETKLDFHLSPDRVFDLCLASLKVLRKYKIKYQNENEGKLVARLPMTWVSTGETVTFQIAKDTNGSTSLNIVSNPIVPSPVYNYQSTEKILEYLKTHTKTTA